MFWATIAGVLFILSVLILLLRKPGHRITRTGEVKGLLVQAYFIPFWTSVLLIIAIVGMLWSIEVDPRARTEVIGLTVSVRALRDMAGVLGVGIVTGVVAGALISAVQRWHDYDKEVDINQVIKHVAKAEGLIVIDPTKEDDA